MGVGKTSLCKILNKRMENSVWLDGDWCWQIHPFNPNEENKIMVEDNIRHLLLNFCKNSQIDHIIFSWVLSSQTLLDRILSWFSNEYCKIHTITLMASDEVLSKRLKKDICLGIRQETSLESSLEKKKLYKAMNTHKLDTTYLSPEQIVGEILNIIE
jgi:broad-specificity NMP kinase